MQKQQGEQEMDVLRGTYESPISGQKSTTWTMSGLTMNSEDVNSPYQLEPKPEPLSVRDSSTTYIPAPYVSYTDNQEQLKNERRITSRRRRQQQQQFFLDNIGDY